MICLRTVKHLFSWCIYATTVLKGLIHYIVTLYSFTYFDGIDIFNWVCNSISKDHRETLQGYTKLT